METIKDLYQTPTPPAVVRGMHPTKRAVERGCDRVAGEDEGRGGACIALPPAGNRTPERSAELRMENRIGDEKRAAVAGGSKCETGRCPGKWLDASVNDRETLTRS